MNLLEAKTYFLGRGIRALVKRPTLGKAIAIRKVEYFGEIFSLRE